MTVLVALVGVILFVTTFALIGWKIADWMGL